VGSTVPLWIAVLLGLIPSVVAVVAIVAAELRDRRRLGHERNMKDAELEAQRETRLRDERIAAYRKLLAATTTAHVEREGVEALSAAYAEISLLASTDEIDRAAARVWTTHGKTQEISRKTKKDPPEASVSDFAQALHKARIATDRFLELAREELQVKDRSAGFQKLEGPTPGEALPGPEAPASRP